MSAQTFGLKELDAIRTAAEQRILDGYASMLNRRTNVENALYRAAKGEGLTPEQCRELGLKLGSIE
jgi:enoyl-CoA hydratase/carnithine racemase